MMAKEQTKITTQIFGEDNFTPKVYISYRAEDNTFVAHAIRDWFLLYLGPMNVVIDVNIPPFVESVEFYLRSKMQDCNIFVPIISPQWLSLLNANLDTASLDLARLEARVAIELNLAITPVYVDNTPVLREIDLPADIAKLATSPHSKINLQSNFEEIMLNVIQDIKNAAQKHLELMRQVDPDAYYVAFEQAMTDGKFEDALYYLNEIHDYAIIPQPFRLQIRQRIRSVKRLKQLHEGYPIYQHIADLVRTNPPAAYDKLTHFFALYPEVGDPSNLFLQLVRPNEEVLTLLQQIEDPDLSAQERLKIGRRLSELDDPRLGVGLRPDGVPDIAWIKIPEGDFIFGFDRHIELPEYFISQYTITHIQFQAFLDDGGLEESIWWEDLAERETEINEQLWQFKNYPRVRVSWYMAVAYCRWLSSKLGTEVRLPTEQEWEKAARGTKGAIYPWGTSYIAGYSNINEAISGISPTNLREPTAVGMYPHGQSPYGVHDMIGNVAEWCLNEFENPDAAPSKVNLYSDQKRPLRGGSWSSDRLFAHTVRRRGELPITQFNDIGFRVACSYLPKINFD